MIMDHRARSRSRSPRRQLDKMNYIMVGNPGVGKSSTINSYVGKILFHSAPSFDTAGITSILDVEESGGKVFLDTPGLNDEHKRKIAALEIEKALGEPGQYRLVFVLLPDEGRVRPDDLTTIKLILDGVNSCKEQVGDDMFSIYVNKVPRRWLKKLRDEGQEENWVAKVMGSLRSRGVPVTKHVHFGLYDDELVSECDKLADLPQDSKLFLDDAPIVFVDGCGTIDADSWEENRQKAADAELKFKEQEELAKKYNEEKNEAVRLQLIEQARANAAILAKDEADERARQADIRAENQARAAAEKKKTKLVKFKKSGGPDDGRYLGAHGHHAKRDSDSTYAVVHDNSDDIGHLWELQPQELDCDRFVKVRKSNGEDHLRYLAAHALHAKRDSDSSWAVVHDHDNDGGLWELVKCSGNKVQLKKYGGHHSGYYLAAHGHHAKRDSDSSYAVVHKNGDYGGTLWEMIPKKQI